MVKNVKVLDEFDPFKNDKVFYELHPPKNAKISAENAALKNPNIQDKFEVTQNDIKIHSADDKVLDFDKTTHWPRPIPMEKHLPPGGSQWSNEAWRILKAQGLCGVLLLLRGQVKSELSLLIAVALVPKKRSRVGSQEQSRAMEGPQEKGRMDGMEQKPLASKISHDCKKTKQGRWSKPQKG